MRRVVFDTNVIAAALRSRNGASFALLRQVADRKLRPLLTIGLFLEYEAVLKRPEQIEVHGLSAANVDAVLAELAALSEPIDVHFRWRPQLNDPKDELVLEAAVNGRAEFLVTHNMRDFRPIEERFDLRVIRPSDLLEELKR